MEQWKWVKGFDGLYQVSNLGNIKSFRNGRNGYLKTNNASTDYITVTLHNGSGRKKTSRVHVLVAESFIGDIPSGWHVHHIDGNKQNNRVDNLEIVHPKDHVAKTIKSNPKIISGMVDYKKFGQKHIQQFDQYGHFIAEYANAKIASELTGICQINILQVANKTEYSPGKIRKQAGGFIWKSKEVV